MRVEGWQEIEQLTSGFRCTHYLYKTYSVKMVRVKGSFWNLCIVGRTFHSLTMKMKIRMLEQAAFERYELIWKTFWTERPFILLIAGNWPNMRCYKLILCVTIKRRWLFCKNIRAKFITSAWDCCHIFTSFLLLFWIFYHTITFVIRTLFRTQSLLSQICF